MEKEEIDAILLGVKTEAKSAIDKANGENAEALKALETKIKGLETSLEGSVSKEKFDIASKELIDLSATMKAMKEEGTNGKLVSFKDKLNEFITDNIDKIKAIHKAGSGLVEFKAVDTIVTTSASNPDGIPELMGVQSAAPTRVNLKAPYIDTLVTRQNTSLAAFPYTESVPKDGDFAFVAEKGTKPQIDFKIETRYAEPRKVAAHEVLSDESVQDIPNLQSVATDYLFSKHGLKRQNGILFGDGVAPNPKGATEYGRVFSAGDLALKVVTPNFMDVVNACITDIFTTHNFVDEVPYMANLVMVNPNDFFIEMVSAKDANGLPLYPTASLFNRVVIGGVTIIPAEEIPAGKIFVSDMSKYNVTNYVPYKVSIGWINDNFITNQFVILGESRFHAFVKKLDEQAFIYDDIATIKTAITKP